MGLVYPRKVVGVGEVGLLKHKDLDPGRFEMAQDQVDVLPFFIPFLHRGEGTVAIESATKGGGGACQPQFGRKNNSPSGLCYGVAGGAASHSDAKSVSREKKQKKKTQY